MNYLLDTHTLLWFLGKKANLSETALQATENPASQCYCSIASLWEMTIKSSLGKLVLPFTLNTLANYFHENEIKILSISLADLVTYQSLPLHHKDPFDRMLIAQAVANNFTIITKDQLFSQYQVSLLW